MKVERTSREVIRRVCPTRLTLAVHLRLAPRGLCYPRGMDRETIKQYLDQTEKHLATSDKLVADQKALIALLEERGRDTARSKTTLAHLEEMQRLHVADRDRLLQALRKLGE